MYLVNNKPNLASVLTVLANNIRNNRDQVDQYLDQTLIPSGFWEKFGIRQLLSNTDQGRWENQGEWQIEEDIDDKSPCRWDHFKNDAIIEGLRKTIDGCAVIQFADWSKTMDASDLWDGLFTDVIKPLNKRDLEFIFQPGDTTKKLVFEVDEMLDIISDYSSYGRVTLVLDNKEADSLWSRLNGGDPAASIFSGTLPEKNEQYLFLFKTMRIDVLLILSGNRTQLFSRDGQFDLTGMSLYNTSKLEYERALFITGYQLGLLLHLEIFHCIALGRLVTGIAAGNIFTPNASALLTCIDEWMEDLHTEIY